MGILASYYPLRVDTYGRCLGGGTASTETSTKGFYLRFLPHKSMNNEYISSDNKTVLSGSMMIQVK